MTLRPVLTHPNDRLRQQAHSVEMKKISSKEIQTLIDDLIDTMHVEKGIGIAATQIGVDKRVIIVDIGEKILALINPEILSRSVRKIDSEEGCLSVPGVYGIVRRHKQIKVRGYDREGNKLTLKATGLLSAVFQHETDHLNGVLFIDKVEKFTSPPRL